ncbi:MAG: hypothetical protein ICV60_06495 [Pyrinomonadaceae bacterium]|nr:hypothetical protein [Pyrinomonadaceae bacterium]
MVTVLITSFLLLAAIIYAAYRWQQTPSSRSAHEDHTLPPQPGWSGLFGEETINRQKQLTRAAEVAEDEKRRAEILSRAALGERSALADARATNDAALYDEVLSALVERADSDKRLLALVSYMLRETPPLGVNRRLAERFMETWKQAPDRGSTAKMLHVVALADDASLYQHAIEAALDFWKRNLIPDLSAEELRQLSESEYWILSQQERSSGQGFILKLKLAALRRQLARSKGATTGDGGLGVGGQ